MSKRYVANGEGRARSAEIDDECPEDVPGKSVYFLQSVNDGLIKIGKAINTNVRSRGIAAMNSGPVVLLASIDGYTRVERFMHQKFSEHRVHHEWFRPNDELSELIGRAKTNRLLARSLCPADHAWDVESQEDSSDATAQTRRVRQIVDVDEILRIWDSSSGPNVDHVAEVRFDDLGLFTQQKLGRGFYWGGQWLGCSTAMWVDPKTKAPQHWGGAGLLPVASHIASFESPRDRKIALIMSAARGERSSGLYGVHDTACWRVIDPKYRPDLHGQVKYTLPTDHLPCSKCSSWRDHSAASEQEYVARLAHLCQISGALARVIRAPDNGEDEQS